MMGAERPGWLRGELETRAELSFLMSSEACTFSVHSAWSLERAGTLGRGWLGWGLGQLAACLLAAPRRDEYESGRFLLQL